VSDSTLDSRINAARKAIGDDGRAQRLIRTSARKGIRFVGELIEATGEGPLPAKVAKPRPGLQQQVHFCTASDGIRIAYALAGEGLPLIKAANWLNHLEYDWQSPIWRPLLHALASEYLLIRYDQRGNGLSDWEVNDISFEAFVRDLESVIEATGLQRFALLGISQGRSVSIAYTVRYPERVSHFILYGGSLFAPEATPEQMQWFNDLQRITTSPDNAVRIMGATGEVDISDLLSQVRVPTLVLHCRNDAAVTFDEGRRLAAGIPDACFVALESCNHLLLESEPAWSRCLEEIKAFLER
jgi:pimeloyl-ACP methyl ester carboxylesterase